MSENSKSVSPPRQRQRWIFLSDLVPHKRFPGAASTLYVHIERGLFPKPTKIGKRLVWPVEMVDAWEQALVDKAFAANRGERKAGAVHARDAQVVEGRG